MTRLTALVLLVFQMPLALAAADAFANFAQRNGTLHFSGFHDGDNPATLDTALQQAEDGFRAASFLTGLPVLPDKIRLILCGRGQESLKGTELEGEEFTALGTVLRDESKGLITILLDASPPGKPDETTVWHETAHALIIGHLKDRDPHLPMWLDEGIAQVTACEDVYSPGILLKAVSNGRTIPLHPWYRPNSDSDYGRLYSQGASMVRYLVRSRGRSALHSILQELAEGSRFPRRLRPPRAPRWRNSKKHGWPISGYQRHRRIEGNIWHSSV